MLLMAEAKPRQSNMRSEGFFFRGHGQYTIFLYSRSERDNFRLAPRPKSWHFLAAVQKKSIFCLKNMPPPSRKWFFYECIHLKGGRNISSFFYLFYLTLSIRHAKQAFNFAKLACLFPFSCTILYHISKLWSLNFGLYYGITLLFTLQLAPLAIYIQNT